MKKVLLKIYPAHNWGDDMFAYIVAKRYPEINFEIKVWGEVKGYERLSSYCPNITIKPYESLPARIFSRLGMERAEIAADCAGYETLIWVGGSLFIEPDNFDYRELERLRHTIKMFRKRGAYILCANFGPYRTEKYVSLCREIFGYFRDVCFREKYSYEMFCDLPCVRQGVDIGFSLKRKRKIKPKTLGVSLINLDIRPELVKYKADYFEFLKKLINDNEGETTLFCFCIPEGERKAADELAQEIGGLKIREYRGDIEEFLDDWLSMERVIATKFHAIVTAAANGVECIPIIYSKKTANVINDMGLYKNAVQIGKNMKTAGYEVAELPDVDAEEVFRAVDERLGRHGS